MFAKLSTLLLIVTLLSNTALAESGKQVHVYSEAGQDSYMWIMTKDTFLGALFGALIGGAVMLLTEFEADPLILAYTTGGGMLGGAGFGLWEVLDQRQEVMGPTASLGRGGGGAGLCWTFRF